MRKYHVHFLQIGHYIAWSYLFLDSRVFNILKRKQDGNSIKMKALKVMFNGTVSTYAFKVNGYTFRGSNPAIFILPPFKIGVHSSGKEFAPLGANSFP